jgi:hypothetical protein
MAISRFDGRSVVVAVAVWLSGAYYSTTEGLRVGPSSLPVVKITQFKFGILN